MAQAKNRPSKTSNQPVAHSIGRRKTSVARAWFRKGAGNVRVNGKDIKTYFDVVFNANQALEPFKVVPMSKDYDVQVTVEGGGKHGQADAIRVALARGLVILNESVKPDLKKYDLLTIDSRVKERKKYGQRGARRKFQFVKR